MHVLADVLAVRERASRHAALERLWAESEGERAVEEAAKAMTRCACGCGMLERALVGGQHCCERRREEMCVTKRGVTQPCMQSEGSCVLECAIMHRT